MPDPKVIDPKHKAKVLRHFKERRGAAVLSNAAPPADTIDVEPAHSQLWLKNIEDQEYTKVDRNGNHIPPRGGSIPTVDGPHRRGLSRKR